MPYVLLIMFLFFLTPIGLAGETIQLFASVEPLAYIAKRIGGDRLKVESIIKTGQSPISYDLLPGQIERLASADIYLRAQLPFEDTWIERFKRINNNMDIINVCDELPVKFYKEKKDHHNFDAHAWTSPINILHIATRLTKWFIQYDPKSIANYLLNFKKLNDELMALHKELRAKLELLQGSSFMVFHPAWTHLGITYGIYQIAIEKEGKEPGPQEIASLVSKIYERNIRIILIQKQFSDNTAKSIAEATGVKLIEVNPLSANPINSILEVAEVLSNAGY